MNDAAAKIIFEELFARYPALELCRCDIWAAYEALRGCFAAGGALLLCGNGGSCADCGHIAGELMKGFMLKRPLQGGKKRALAEAGPDGAALAAGLQGALRAIDLCAQSPIVTAVANDINPAFIYAQQVYALGGPNDALIAISTSGRAENVYYALVAARAAKMKRIGLTGGDGGRMAALCDVAIKAPATLTHEVQEYHLPIYHALCAMLESCFFA